MLSSLIAYRPRSPSNPRTLLLPCLLSPERYGRVRLRFSVKWHSNFQRIARYPAALSGGDGPDILPFNDRRWMIAALFATQGPSVDKSFKWSVCRARINEAVEVLSVVSLAQRAIKSIICYRKGNVLTSLLCGLMWQLCCVQPNFLPSCYPLLLLAILSVQHSRSGAYALGARAAPGAMSITRSFFSFLLGAPRGHTANPPSSVDSDPDDSDEDTDDEDAPTYSSELAKARLERIAAKHKAATEAAKRRPRRKAASCTAVSKARVPDDAVSLAPASLQRQASLDEDLLLHGLAGALERQRREAEVNSRFASAMAHPQRRSPVGAACCLLFADITARLPCPAVSLVVDGDHCGAHPI